MRRIVFLGIVLLALTYVSVLKLAEAAPLNTTESPTITTVVPQPPAAPLSTQPHTVSPHSLLAELNYRRKLAGLQPLQLDVRLNNSAQAKCDEMFAHKYYSHEEPTSGKRGYEIAREHLDNAAGTFAENLNSRLPSTATPQDIFNSWFTSEPHKQAALSANYSLTGFGYCTASVDVPSANYRTVVQHFYGPPS